MTLGDVIETVRRREATLRVFNPEGDVVDDLSDFLADRNVAVRAEETDSGRPEDFAVLERNGQQLAAVDVAELRSLLTGSAADATALGVDVEAGSDIMRYLEETTFSSYDRERMLAATREIEDRAFRVGEGTLRAGFQTPDRLATQQETYAELGRAGLETVAYAVPHGDVPDVPCVTVRTPDTEEIERHWFVAFDGGGEADRKCALLAEEREDGFYGIWTYDPGTVDEIHEHLRGRYDRQATPS